MDRRQFITATTAAAGVSLSLAARQRLIAQEVADQKPKRVGLIGCGWYGKNDLFRLIQVAPVEVVSLCDVDQRQMDMAADIVSQRQKSHKRPRLFGDYRELLKEKDLDIVCIGTPDHWHALTMIAAVEAGADVYCQKPISVDVAEGRAMLAAARKHNRVVQVGTQRRSTPHLVEAREKIVNAGLLERSTAELRRRAIFECAAPFAATGKAPMTGNERERIVRLLAGGAGFRFEAGRRIRFRRRGERLEIRRAPEASGRKKGNNRRPVSVILGDRRESLV